MDTRSVDVMSSVGSVDAVLEAASALRRSDSGGVIELKGHEGFSLVPESAVGRLQPPHRELISLTPDKSLSRAGPMRLGSFRIVPRLECGSPTPPPQCTVVKCVLLGLIKANHRPKKCPFKVHVRRRRLRSESKEAQANSFMFIFLDFPIERVPEPLNV